MCCLDWSSIPNNWTGCAGATAFRDSTFSGRSVEVMLAPVAMSMSCTSWRRGRGSAGRSSSCLRNSQSCSAERSIWCLAGLSTGDFVTMFWPRPDRSMRRELLLLGEMIDAAVEAQRLVEGMDIDGLADDRQRRDALLGTSPSSARLRRSSRRA